MYRTAPPIPSVDRIRSINSPAMGKVTFTQPSSAAAAFLLLLTFNLQSSSFYSFAVQSSQLDITPTTRLMSSMTSSSTPSRSTTDSSSTYLDDIPMGPPDSILGIAAAFRACTDPNKVNICVGAYRDENGQPWVLPSVRAAEQKMLQENANKEYAPIEGDLQFVNLAIQFAYGPEVDVHKVAAIQTLSGTGACRIAGEFYSRFLPKGTKIYIPEPTWGNHIAIYQNCGLDVQRYRYYDYRENALDFDGMVQDLQQAPNHSIILLHGCAHNPTGCDPTMEQWKAISSVIREKNHYVFFDVAYQGFATGDAERDAEALRYFVREGHSVGLAQSFAKNFGLYGERCGTLSFLCPSTEVRAKVLSQLQRIVRPMYSSPPIHGSSIVKTVLSDDALKAQYYEECASMAKRIQQMRELLVSQLANLGSTHDWSHILSQIGMFAFTGMDSDMCDELTVKYSIFLTKDGRISLAGLNAGNVEYVARAIHHVTDGKKIKRTE